MKMPLRPGRKSPARQTLTRASPQAEPRYHINPRYRAYGKARLDIARRVQTQADWDSLWKQPANPFPFTFGGTWKQSIEYKVDDFAAEVGFYTDILGLPVYALGPSYAQFTGPENDFFFAVTPTPPDDDSTPPEAIRIQFYLQGLLETVEDLEKRGVIFELKPQPTGPGASLYVASFRTPHGISIDLLGEASPRSSEVEADIPGAHLPEQSELTKEAAPITPSPENNQEKPSELTEPEIAGAESWLAPLEAPASAKGEASQPEPARKRTSRRGSRKEKPATPKEESPQEPAPAAASSADTEELPSLETGNLAAPTPPRPVTPWDFLEASQEESSSGEAPFEPSETAPPSAAGEATPGEPETQKKALETEPETPPASASFLWTESSYLVHPGQEDKQPRLGARFANLEEENISTVEPGEVGSGDPNPHAEEPFFPNLLDAENSQQVANLEPDETATEEEATETGRKDDEPVYEDITYEDLDEEQLNLFEEASEDGEDTQPRKNGSELRPGSRSPFPHTSPRRGPRP